MTELRCRCAGEKCTLSADDDRHGSHNGYQNRKCRCEECRTAYARQQGIYKQRRVARGIPEHAHGTAGGYGNWGCRCDPCTAAWSVDNLDRSHRRRDGLTDVAQGLYPGPQWRFADRPHAPLNRQERAS